MHEAQGPPTPLVPCPSVVSSPLLCFGPVVGGTRCAAVGNALERRERTETKGQTIKGLISIRSDKKPHDTNKHRRRHKTPGEKLRPLLKNSFPFKTRQYGQSTPQPRGLRQRKRKKQSCDGSPSPQKRQHLGQSPKRETTIRKYTRMHGRSPDHGVRRFAVRRKKKSVDN